MKACPALTFPATRSESPGSMNRNFAAVKRSDPVLVAVDANNMVSEIGKARPRHQPDVTGANHSNVHS